MLPVFSSHPYLGGWLVCCSFRKILEILKISDDIPGAEYGLNEAWVFRFGSVFVCGLN